MQPFLWSVLMLVVISGDSSSLNFVPIGTIYYYWVPLARGASFFLLATYREIKKTKIYL